MLANLIPDNPEIKALYQALQRAWSAETSQDSCWSPRKDVLSLGQCVPTSLVVQDLFGGEILTARFGYVEHNWNLLPSGEEVDLSRDQFTASTKMETKPRKISRVRALRGLDGGNEYETLLLRLRELDVAV
jgi:hypothetical protein